MATARLLQTPARPFCSSGSPSFAAAGRTVGCLNLVAPSGGERSGFEKPKMVVKAAASAVAAESARVITAEPWINGVGADLASFVGIAVSAALVVLRAAVKRRPMKLNVQCLVEKAIVDCRFFTLFAVAGSLLGSVLCFVEGCVIVIESYVEYFQSMSRMSDQGHVVLLLIEGLDMFLVGTAMLIFGVSLHVMFVGSQAKRERGPWLSGSNLFGLYYLTRLPAWAETQSVSQAKSRIGHAMMMILQVGVLEKFKSIPVLTCLDLACFAGAVLLSSACIFLLSRLSLSSSSADGVTEKTPL
ncbi:uncharacterized protein LOC115670037 isoform X1 [Syzygium oleosum]|uniref:uncharacterized protein LOC115670037 isoform X1 n=1 Tax=Syzygium oleosum TaxID=219896 RepID=UPI0011D21A2A|nr:uncharacterized protein LOC115670037 isoform X1 [Syzygium oleosum]